MRVELPYGRGSLSCQINGCRILTSRIGQMDVPKSGPELVAQAMARPFGGQTLRRLAEGKRRATLLLSDHTRPVPSRDIVPQMLAELRQGQPDIEVTLLVATGCHRGTTRQELVRKLGEDLVARERIVIHDAFSAGDHVPVGTLPSGAPLVVNRLAVETDLLAAEGFIEPHFFAGFSGGRKSVLPGVCAQRTVLENHCGRFIADPAARTGVLEGNPIHRDMEAAAEMVRLQYIVNVVIRENQETAAAFAGDFREAHAVGVAFLRRCCQVPAVPGDIIITTNGGAPLDQNLYQCVKALTAAEACARPNAVIILCAELADGLGGDGFYRAMRDTDSPRALFETYSRRSREETEPDQWQAQILCRVLMKHRVILVTRPDMRSSIEEMHMEYARSPEEALAMAGAGQITVIPNGVSVVIENRSE